MGIREEIGKLKMAETMLARLTGHAFTAMQERNNTLVDVLSILDKWECVGEIVMPDHALLSGFQVDTIERQMWNVINNSKPGDHIIIWRKKDESSS